MKPSQHNIDDLERRLRKILGSRCSALPSDRRVHGRDESYHAAQEPDLVVYPENVEDVVQIVGHCSQLGVPIIPFGAGTSIEGQILAVEGGVAVDMSRMNRILDIRQQDMLAVVEPGVTRNQLNTFIRDQGLMFVVDPGADATIGGMASTRAAGSQTVRYGSMRDNTLSLQAVLADGQVIRTTKPVRKSSAGYDLTRLFVGSEGTLGILTEVTVRLHPIPDYVIVGLCGFGSISKAIETVVSTMQYGFSVARLELIDANEMNAICDYSNLPYERRVTVMVEFHGERNATRHQIREFEQLLGDTQGTSIEWLEEREEQGRLWKARHDAHYANMAFRPGCRVFATDTCVPLSRLAECIDLTMRDIEGAPVPVVISGHVGDGNFHLGLLIDPESSSELDYANAINAKVVKRAIKMGGTCTGEHGIGVGKIGFLAEELASCLPAMRAIKSALDPQGIMNPGKVLSTVDV